MMCYDAFSNTIGAFCLLQYSTCISFIAVPYKIIALHQRIHEAAPLLTFAGGR